MAHLADRPPSSVQANGYDLAWRGCFAGRHLSLPEWDPKVSSGCGKGCRTLFERPSESDERSQFDVTIGLLDRSLGNTLNLVDQFSCRDEGRPMRIGGRVVS